MGINFNSGFNSYKPMNNSRLQSTTEDVPPITDFSIPNTKNGMQGTKVGQTTRVTIDGSTLTATFIPNPHNEFSLKDTAALKGININFRKV